MYQVCLFDAKEVSLRDEMRIVMRRVTRIQALAGQHVQCVVLVDYAGRYTSIPANGKMLGHLENVVKSHVSGTNNRPVFGKARWYKDRPLYVAMI